MNRRLLQPVFVLLATLLAATVSAQTPTGRIVGRIMDGSTGQGLTDVGVQVVGTSTGAMSGLDGRYQLGAVPAGTVTLHVRRIGYGPKTITGIVLSAGATIEQDVALAPANVELEAVEVTASAERGSVNAALDAQRNATGIVNAVTAEQISRSPDGDAAAAVQRVSGVTVQDGKYVFVRGLGERYTTTSLNGARVPSPEPERKVVPLDLFPSSLLQSVTTSKTFTPDLPGDFSGAQVDIRTREFPAQRQVSYSLSMGFNDRATGKDLPAAPTEGLEWLGLAAGERALPGLVRQQGSFSGSYSPDQYNQFVRSFRNVWSADRRGGAPNSSFAVTVGGNDPVFGRRIGYVASLSYGHTTETRADETRAFAIPVNDGASTAEVNRYDGSTGRTSVLWGGLLNLSTLLGSGSRVSLNNTITRSADNEARVETGFDEDDGVPLHIQRLRYVERFVRSTQLAGEHQLGSSQRFDWSLNASGVTRREPDRSVIAYVVPEDGTAPFLYNDAEAAVRLFGDLTEDSYSASGDYSFRFGTPGREHLLKLGAMGRYTTRDADNTPYYFQVTLAPEERVATPEQIFDSHSRPGESALRVGTLFSGGSYGAEDALGAGYGMLEYQLSDRFRLIGGARVEAWSLDVKAAPIFGAATKTDRVNTDVLPALTLNVGLTPSQNLRFSASQTLARPEYREVAPIQYYDVIGGELIEGNPALERTLIRNADVRWEWYPNAGEVLSLGVFAKQFDNPIERVYVGTSGTAKTRFENADGATNYGVELEMRKGLGFLGGRLAPLSVFSNATLMRSEIDLSAAGAGAENADRAMVGQAPYVVNAGLTYASAGGGASATVLYNVVGRRIYSASLLRNFDVYEEARNVLDLSLRFPLHGGLAGKVDLRNLLDEPYEITQGSVTRESYRAGRVFSLGVSWRP